MRTGRLLLAAALAAGLTSCSGTPERPPVTATDSTPSADLIAAGVPAEISLADIAKSTDGANCFTLIHPEQGGRWAALPDTCNGETDWTLADTHTIPLIPIGDIREGRHTDLESASAFTTDQGLPAVTWRAPVWMATNEYTQWEEWAGVVTVEPSAELGNSETVFVMVQAKIEGAPGVPPVAREEFDAAVTTLVVVP